jgi:hypothetical protein
MAARPLHLQIQHPPAVRRHVDGHLARHPVPSSCRRAAAPSAGDCYQVQSAKCQVPSTKYQVPSTKYQVPSTKCQVPSTKYQVPSTKYQVPSTKYQVPSTKYQVPSTKCQVPSTKYQVPSTKYQVPSAKCQVPSAKCQVPSAKYEIECCSRRVRASSIGQTVGGGGRFHLKQLDLSSRGAHTVENNAHVILYVSPPKVLSDYEYP